jgi:hypothetical protein
MRTFVHYVPIATTFFAIWFGWIVLSRYRERRSGPHLLWWGIGLLMYGVGTATESLTTLFGWQESVFRTWYISGALLGGAPLAQGTVYLLMKRKTADRLTIALLTVVAIAATFVLLTPIDFAAVESHRLSGRVMEWSWVRAFSPFINLYAATLLVGGAVYSAVKFRGLEGMRHRVIGNVLIAVGALLPGIGGSFTRFGHVEVLYVTEILGIILIYLGYKYNVSSGVVTRPEAAADTATQATPA